MIAAIINFMVMASTLKSGEPIAFVASPEAMAAYANKKHLLSDEQSHKLLQSTLSLDGSEWCILSGTDLTFDRAGFGATIADALEDYISIYIKRD
ncbi:MAG: hypothetical protein ACK502_06560 [Alphaproteobacteria bacterium]